VTNVTHPKTVTHLTHDPLTHFPLIRDRSPAYFRDICVPVVAIPFHSRLCSADKDDMVVPRTLTTHNGPCSFRVVVTQIWNTLPSHLGNVDISHEQFKLGLETWPFVQADSQETPLRTLFNRHPSRIMKSFVGWLSKLVVG